MASAVQWPFLKFPFLEPRGAPVLNPPCKRHRLRPCIAGHSQGVPARVFAPQRAARLKFASRISALWFMRLSANFFSPPAGSSSAGAAGLPLQPFGKGRPRFFGAILSADMPLDICVAGIEQYARPAALPIIPQTACSRDSQIVRGGLRTKLGRELCQSVIAWDLETVPDLAAGRVSDAPSARWAAQGGGSSSWSV
jgi:hypothetical protein